MALLAVLARCFKELTNLMKEDAEMAGEAGDAAKDQMVQTPGVLVVSTNLYNECFVWSSALSTKHVHALPFGLVVL